MLPQTVARLAELPEVVAIKEAPEIWANGRDLETGGDKITLLRR